MSNQVNLPADKHKLEVSMDGKHVLNLFIHQYGPILSIDVHPAPTDELVETRALRLLPGERSTENLREWFPSLGMNVQILIGGGL